MNNTAPVKKTVYDIFESVTCSRCGGNPDTFRRFGHVIGGRCLKCNGNLREFTRHGQADYDRYRAAVDAVTLRPLESIKPGDFVRLRDMRSYAEVAEVSGPVQTGAYIKQDEQGNRIEDPIYHITVTFVKPVRVDSVVFSYTGREVSQQLLPGSVVRVRPAEGMPKAEDFVTPKKQK